MLPHQVPLDSQALKSPPDTGTAAPIVPERPPLFSPEELQAFKSRVSPLIGLDLDAYKPRQMERRITALMYRAKLFSLDNLYDQLSSDPLKLYDFICGLTINVTEFFRNPERYEVLEQQILPELLARFDRLKIWSAGCSNGAELYTVGILLESLGALDRCELVGTDLDGKIIQKAEVGLYHDYEVKAVPPAVMDRYFQAEGPLFRFTGEAIRRRCHFTTQNLLDDAPELNCHLIVCRNVVIYFNEDGKRRLYQRFEQGLEPGGVLFVGNTERIFEHRELGFTLASPFFYQKAPPT